MAELRRDTSYVPELLQSFQQLKEAAGDGGPGSPFQAVRGVASTGRLDAQQASPALDSAPLLEPVGAAMGAILDEDVAARDPGAPIRRGIERELGSAWELLTDQARVALLQGDRLRGDIATHYGASAEADFAIAVMAYSRALEVELFRRLFEPFRNAEPLGDVLTGDEAVDLSLKTMRRFQQEETQLGMGQMAACLENLACSQAPSNAFADHLGTRISDFGQFCESRYPKWLKRFANGYRNRAAHIQSLSQEDCDKARDYLLHRPRRLLLVLVELTGAT